MRAMCACVAGIVFVLTVPSARGDVPEPPAAVDAAAAAAAKKKAEDARFADIPMKHRDALRFIDETNPKLMDAWCALRDVIRAQVELDQVWGTGDRKKAERRKVELEAQLPALRQTFKELRDSFEPGICRQRDKARRAADRLADQSAAGNEQGQLKRDEEGAALRAETVRCEAVLGALRSMGTFSASRYRYSVEDRLATLGIDRNDDAVRENAEDFEKILEAVFTVRDRIEEVEELEALKAAGEGWDRRHEFTLTRATEAMERAGQRLEQLAARDQAAALKELDRLQAKIEELEARMGKLPPGSASHERLSKERWGLEAMGIPHANRVATLKRLADWKRLRNATRDVEPAR